MSNHDELIAQFTEISGGEESVARFYLSNSNWSLEDALSNFLVSQGEGDDREVDVELNADSAALDATAPLSTNEGGAAFKSTNQKPRFGTLKDMNRRSSQEEEGQAFYAGGSDRSGQQILGPPKKKNFREQLTDMFRMAHSHASSEDSEAPSTSSGAAAAWGQGVRLGMTDTDHAIVTPLPAKRDASEQKPVVVLKLWSQGFSIDGGELRLYDDPENKEFLETVMRGEIPNELLQMGYMVNVDVEDHRHEQYKKVVTVSTFRGSGHALGSPVPNVEENVPIVPEVKPTTAKPTADGEEAAKKNLNLNSAQPFTTLQIRLADGSRLTAQFNLTHTVADIHQYIQSARPEYVNRNFSLVSSFPTRQLDDKTATIEQARLQNAALMQRLI